MGNLLHVSSYRASIIIHTERWSIVGWLTCKMLPFCFGPILIISCLRRKNIRLSPAIHIHVLGEPGNEADISLSETLASPKWQTFFNLYFVSSRTCQESGRWGSCWSIHCWAATWCHMWDWYHLECHTLQKTASRCKQHEHLWFYSIIIHSLISKAWTDITI